MLDNKIRSEIIKTREQVLSKLRGRINQPLLLDSAKKRWIAYQPHKTQCYSIGIDGSHNINNYTGLSIYLVDALAVDMLDNYSIVKSKYDIEAKNAEHLMNMMHELEIDIADEILNVSKIQADLILTDGAISATLESGLGRGHYPDGKRKVRSFLDSIIRNQNEHQQEELKMIFISKNSDSRKQFKSLPIELQAPDIWYFDKAGGKERSPGFSMPFEDDSYLRDFGVSIIEVYARLMPDTSTMKIEFLNTSGKRLTLEDMDKLRREKIPELLNKLLYRSVSGYPSCLRLAHEKVRISKSDIDEIAHIYGVLYNDVPSREVFLHES